MLRLASSSSLMFGRRHDAVLVTRGLWVGSAPSARAAKMLVAEGITAVVDLRAERGDATPWPASVVVQHVPLIDHGSPTDEQLRDAAGTVTRLMHDGREVLVHCRAGLERSPTVACAVLMLQGWSLADAYRRVTEARAGAAPTEGQLAALTRLEKALTERS